MLLNTVSLSAAENYTRTLAGDGYTMADLELETASALFDLCTAPARHEHYAVAKGFCYGFFEGVTQFDDALPKGNTKGRKSRNQGLMCPPNNITREEAINVFTDYLHANPQYNSDTPLDGIYRSLTAKWPCK
jgi:hypothetical protein